MGTQKNAKKKMMTNESIYKIMQWLPLVVSAVFFVINVTKGNTTAMLVIGLCLAVLIAIMVIAKVKNVPLYNKELIMAIALPILIFMISMFSGESYSDDFILFLAVVALTGLYLEPMFTLIQMFMCDTCLIAMYFIHPEKAGDTSQYILCLACFMLAIGLYYYVIKRGRAFIEMSEEKAKESEKLLESIREMGAELQTDFDASSMKIETSTKGLQGESVSIARGAGLVSESCNVVQDKLRETEDQIRVLNEGVKQFEISLNENKENMESMNEQVENVSEIITETGTVFRNMEEQMQEIAGIAKQISDISFRLTILSLNASVEAAHAGEYGAGFEVLAGEMRALSESSAGFSDRVSDVVRELLVTTSDASERVTNSEDAFGKSEKVMAELVGSFAKLNEQFSDLYSSIENQTRTVNQIDYIFADLNQRAADMHSSSLANQDAVEGIADAMMEFSGNVGKIVKNTQSI